MQNSFYAEQDSRIEPNQILNRSFESSCCNVLSVPRLELPLSDGSLEDRRICQTLFSEKLGVASERQEFAEKSWSQVE